jgi:broad specificity phosphatase PhoE
MTHLYIIRHGKYIGNVDGKLVDNGLSPEGIQQAELLRDRHLSPPIAPSFSGDKVHEG